jgi:hypothetical protein
MTIIILLFIHQRLHVVIQHNLIKKDKKVPVLLEIVGRQVLEVDVMEGRFRALLVNLQNQIKDVLVFGQIVANIGYQSLKVLTIFPLKRL